jgi:hypothetical protein
MFVGLGSSVPRNRKHLLSPSWVKPSYAKRILFILPFTSRLLIESCSAFPSENDDEQNAASRSHISARRRQGKPSVSADCPLRVHTLVGQSIQNRPKPCARAFRRFMMFQGHHSLVWWTERLERVPSIVVSASERERSGSSDVIKYPTLLFLFRSRTIPFGSTCHTAGTPFL